VPEARSTTVSAGALDVHYLEVGSGLLLVLLHGGTATAAIYWQEAFRTMSGRWRLIAPDTGGHGKTLTPPITSATTRWQTTWPPSSMLLGWMNARR
jgi:pimeloyl-ACP methyl ester carboxylesterase